MLTNKESKSFLGPIYEKITVILPSVGNIFEFITNKPF